MEFPLILLGLIVVLGLGYIIGLVHNGVNITINHVEKKAETPVTEDGKPKYNPTFENLTDPATRQYLEQNNGQIKL